MFSFIVYKKNPTLKNKTTLIAQKPDIFTLYIVIHSFHPCIYIYGFEEE